MRAAILCKESKLPFLAFALLMGCGWPATAAGAAVTDGKGWVAPDQSEVVEYARAQVPFVTEVLTVFLD